MTTPTTAQALLASAAILLPFVNGPVAAQEASPNEKSTSSLATGAAGPAANKDAAPGDIIVTAQRRSQSIAKVGISITALTGDTLAHLGVQSTQGLAAHVPSLLFDGGSGGGVNAFVSIRGVSQVDYSEHQEAPNAVYLDEVYVPTPSMIGFPVYDLERAEALRGPQGTLFGRNSTGGLLQFITVDPTDAVTGYADVSYANFNTKRAEGALGGPLGGGVNFRVAGFVDKGDGYFKNLLPGGHDTFETDAFGLRGKLATRVGSWEIKVTGSYNKEPRHREGTYKSKPAYVDSNGVSQFVPANVDIYGTGPGKDPYGNRDTSPGGNEGAFNDVGFLRKDYYYGTAKISGPIGGATLTSITNYSHAGINYLEDAEGSAAPVYEYGSGGRTRQISEELRANGHLPRMNWTLGAYFLDIRGSYYLDSNLLPLAAVLGQGPFHSIETYQQQTRSYALFGQAEYDLTHDLKLTAGARYTNDRKHFNSITTDVTSGIPVVLADFEKSTVGNLSTLKHGDWAGKVQLDYTGLDNLLLYASVSRGIRGGGFNANVFGNIPNAQIPFKNETVLSYESGAKYRFLDGKGHLFLSAFYYNYKDFQAYSFVSTTVLVSNLPARMYGGEAEFSYNPTRDISLSLGGSYLHGRVEHVSTGTSTIDVPPVKAPKWTFNGIASKSFEFGVGRLALQYDFNYVSENNANLVPSPITRLPASWIHNARISFTPAGTGLEIYGFVRNFTNTNRESFAYDNSFIGLANQSYAPPRTYGAGFRKTF